MRPSSVVPYLYYEDATAAVEFLTHAFGFEVEAAFRNEETGEVLHATLQTGSGQIFVGPGMAAFGTAGTRDADAVASMTYVFVDDVDEHHARACRAGVLVREPPHDHFGGNRQYTASDPGGQRWTFAQAGAQAGAGEDPASVDEG